MALRKEDLHKLDWEFFVDLSKIVKRSPSKLINYKHKIEDGRVISLDLDGLNPNIVPVSLSNLTELENISMKNNETIRLPDSIGELKKLKSITIPNKGVILPPSFGGLSGFSRLSIALSNIMLVTKNPSDTMNVLQFLRKNNCYLLISAQLQRNRKLDDEYLKKFIVD